MIDKLETRNREVVITVQPSPVLYPLRSNVIVVVSVTVDRTDITVDDTTITVDAT